VQAAAGDVEAREVALLADREQPSGQVVAPAVVAAEEALGRALLALDQRRAAVAAGVVERADLPVVAARDDDRRAGPAPQAVAAGRRQLVGVQRVQPRLLPEVPLLECEELRIRVAADRDTGSGGKPGGVPSRSCSWRMPAYSARSTASNIVVPLLDATAVASN
jgi:hypothetical protein